MQGLKECVQTLGWDSSPKGDAVEDDEQNDAPGFQWTFEHVLNGHKALKVKPEILFINGV